MSARPHPQRSTGSGDPWGSDVAELPVQTRCRGRQNEARAALVLFALALVAALGAVIMLIGSGYGHAVPTAQVALAKSSGWVGLAAIASVFVSAVGGVAFLRRHLSSRRR